tara:strand:+ start:4186 stop:4548 length:363 start_codon:yes stop_codon:yes gene_type:complete
MFLSGFIQIASLIGPGVTVISSGNLYKAGAQLLIDSEIKKKTGKNSLAFVTDEMKKKSKKKGLNEELRELVKKRIILTQKKLAKQNNQKKENEAFKNFIEKRILMVQKELKLEKISVNNF